MKKKYLIALSIVCCSLLGAGYAHAQSWQNVGMPGFTAGEADYESITFGKNDTPYVAYLDQANNDGPTVMKFNGTSWVVVGTPGFTGNLASYTSIVTDSSGTPYLTFADGNDTQKATVMKYNGSSWETLGSPGLSIGIANFTSLAIGSSDTLYAIFADQADSCLPKLSVMKYNGSSWVNVGPVRFSPILTNGAAIAVHGNTPYITYPDSSIVRMFDGSNWVPVGALSGLGAGMQSMSLAVDNMGTPYVAYSDNTNAYKATVIKYNGTAWVYVGTPDFSFGEADNISLAINGSGTPYIVYSDAGTTDFYATVKKFDGTNWVTVGTPGLSGTLAQFTDIAINSAGIPYVFYQGFSGGQRGTVQKFANTTIVKNVSSITATLAVFPDPSNGAFTLHISSPGKETAAVTITNVAGEKVKEFTAATNTDMAVQLSVAPGMYFVNALIDGETVVEKIVVE
jgi:hypothetical protein